MSTPAEKFAASINANGFAREPQWHRHFGCTYSTERNTFGDTLAVFPVAPDWDGFRFHGYCFASRQDVLEAYGSKGAAMRHFRARFG